MSLIQNKIEKLLESPDCPHLQTLFLNFNNLDEVDRGFFQSMPSLRVLSLSYNHRLWKLPHAISNLVSLQNLDLSNTRLEKLTESIKCLFDLKCLNLDNTIRLHTIPLQIISNLKKLQVLRMFLCGAIEQEERSILFGGSELLVEELLGLDHLHLLGVTIGSLRALQRLLSSPRLQTSTQSLFLRDFYNSRSPSALSVASLRTWGSSRLSIWMK